MAQLVKQHEGIAIAPFKPHPWQYAPLLDKSETLLLWGPSGGGKSHLAAEKLVAFALHYPGASVVACRKKFEDALQSQVPLIRDNILDCSHNPQATFRARENRIIIDHGTGKPISEIIFTGIYDEKSREGIKSIGMRGAIDMWWSEEATELEEEDYNIITTRVRGDIAGWGQHILTTNPGGTLHFINRRLIIGGEASHYYSRPEQNPSNPAGYIGRLKKLTGVDRLRLWKGVWADGVGQVIDTWLDRYNAKTGDAPGNVRPDADYIPGAGPVLWFMDDGYAGQRDKKTQWFTARSNPRVFLLAQVRSDDQMIIFDEHYEVQILADSHIALVKKMSADRGYPEPNYAVYDGAAPSLGGQLARAGVKSKPIRVKIEEGIKEVREACGEDFNGRRRVLVHPRCQFLRMEMGSYAYDKTGNPIDAHNHGPDALRYGIWYETYGKTLPGQVAASGVDMDEMDARIAKAMARAMEKYANAL